MRYLPFLLLLVTAMAGAQPPARSSSSPHRMVETDSESGAEVFLLGADERPADNIYGEQPYGDATGRRIAIRYYPLPDKPGGLEILDLENGARHEILSGKPPFPAFHAWGEWLYYAHAKHEQFSRDGRNRVLIQLNQMPEVKVVLLSELEIGGNPVERTFPADQPYTRRPTGHEAWIGATSRIFFSTSADASAKGNVWSAQVGDAQPTLVSEDGKRFGHISVSRDGKFWIGDTGEQGIPVYIGSFATGRARRVCFSRTEYDKQQWSHAHPYLTADNRWLIFGARRQGHPQVFGAKLKDFWLETL